MQLIPRQRPRRLLVLTAATVCGIGLGAWLWAQAQAAPAGVLTSGRPPAEKLQAVHAIENAPTTSAIAVLAQAAGDADPQVAAAAIAAIGRLLNDAPKARAAVADGLDHADADVRHAAVVSYARTFPEGSAEHSEKLTRLLTDDASEKVRAAAAQTLGRLQTFDAVFALVDAMADPSPQVADAAFRSACAILCVRTDFDPRAPLNQRRQTIARLRARASNPELRKMHAYWLQRRRAKRP